MNQISTAAYLRNWWEGGLAVGTLIPSERRGKININRNAGGLLRGSHGIADFNGESLMAHQNYLACIKCLHKFYYIC